MNINAVPEVTGVDSHAHIFRQDLPMVANRRYSPSYDALATEYLAHILESGLSHGVLVQPSFLGTDNHFLEQALIAEPERLRGVVVLDPETSREELDRLNALGVVGVRLNLIGKEPQDYTQAVWQTFFAHLAELEWHVEIQSEFAEFSAFLPQILASGVRVVIDHFGRPNGVIDAENPKHAQLLALASHEQVWFKLSGAYRAKANLTQAQALYEQLKRAAGGISRFVWGSDWPNTQFEDQTSYAAQFSFFNSMVRDTAERQQILADNAVRLFHFNTPVTP